MPSKGTMRFSRCIFRVNLKSDQLRFRRPPQGRRSIELVYDEGMRLDRGELFSSEEGLKTERWLAGSGAPPIISGTADDSTRVVVTPPIGLVVMCQALTKEIFSADGLNDDTMRAEIKWTRCPGSQPSSARRRRCVCDSELRRALRLFSKINPRRASSRRF